MRRFGGCSGFVPEPGPAWTTRADARVVHCPSFVRGRWGSPTAPHRRPLGMGPTIGPPGPAGPTRTEGGDRLLIRRSRRLHAPITTKAAMAVRSGPEGVVAATSEIAAARARGGVELRRRWR